MKLPSSIYDLKPAFQRLLRPLCGRLSRSGITPNQVTTTALLLSCVMGGMLFYYRESKWPLFMLPVFLFVRMGLNALDGMLAREHDMESKLGVMLNEIGDVCSDTVIYLPLASLHQMPPIPIVLIVILSIVSEMTGVIALQISGVRRYDGPMGKSDRAFALGLIALLVGLNVVPQAWITAALWVIVMLLFLTIGNRWQKTLKDEALRDL